MNLFLTRLTGKLMSSEKFENHIRGLIADMRRFRQIEASKEYQEYVELKQIVEDPKFQAYKKELLTRKFKDTKEYEQMQTFKKLHKSKQVKKYLKAETEEEKAEALELADVKRYVELKEIVNSDYFRKAYDFNADKKRWFVTEESNQDSRYAQLCKNKDIQFFLRQDAERIAAMELWQEAFLDKFADSKNWRPGFAYAQKEMKKVHSFVNEEAAYVGGKNISVGSGLFSLITRKEHVTTSAWDEKKGFVLKDFDYTTDCASTVESFNQAEGLFMAKVRVKGKQHSHLCLAGTDNVPVIELCFYNGRRNFFGTVGKNLKNLFDLRGVSASSWNIYSAMVTNAEVVFYINNLEVFRAPNPCAGQPLHFVALSSLPQGLKGEGELEIDWVRAFKK